MEGADIGLGNSMPKAVRKAPIKAGFPRSLAHPAVWRCISDALTEMPLHSPYCSEGPHRVLGGMLLCCEERSGSHGEIMDGVKRQRFPRNSYDDHFN